MPILRLPVASFTDPSTPRDVTIDGEAYRMLTVPVEGVGAVQIARSARETERALDVIRTRTWLSVALVIAAAAIAGWLIGRQVTRRLVRLTQAADDVASTGRLDVEVPVSGSDETGRLGLAFNGMLGALARSRDQQHQLVQDAGHELRTPLTSLRTNVAVLRRLESLAPEARQQLVDDLDSETKELTALVNELVELATDRRDDEPAQECDLTVLTEQAAARVRRRTGREVIGRRRHLDGVVPTRGDRSSGAEPHRQRGQVQRRHTRFVRRDRGRGARRPSRGQRPRAGHPR